MESNDTVLDNGVSPGMEELDREINEDDYDVNSIDINSRDASLASALDFHPGYVGSRTNTSSNGRRTVKTRKSVPPPASESSGPRSRAPPKKPYEPAPFLSIDNLPQEKRNLQNEGNKKDRSKRSSPGMKVPSNTPNGQYGPGTQGTKSGLSLSCSSTEWNKMVPRSRHRNMTKQAGQVLPNGHVQNPFKHSKSATSSQRSTITPDQSLKEMTVLATYEVAKAIAKTPPETEKKIPGRLLKARLKPLNTVNMTGPSIHHCRGIVAGAHGYSPSPNRTLQRRRHLLNNLNSNYMRERPQTAESLHHTSVASESTGMHEHDELDYLLMGNNDFDEADDFRIPPNSMENFAEHLVTSSLPAQQLRYHQNNLPEASANHQSPLEASTNHQSARNRSGDEGENDEEDPDIQEVTEAEKYFLDSDDDVRRSCDGNTRLGDINNPQRPKSTYSSGQRKSVRFAESGDSNAEMLRERSRSAMPGFRPDRVPNPQLSEIERDSKQKSRSSCRPDEGRSSLEEDPDHDGGGGSSRGSSRAWSDRNNMNCSQPVQSPDAPSSGRRASGGNKDDEGEVLRTSFGEVQFGFDDADLANQRPSSEMGMRPRSRLGEWEDVIKPGDCADLVISGQGKDMSERDPDTRDYRRTGGYQYSGRRPQSAKAPYDSVMEERRQLMKKQRPASARADCLGLDKYSVSMSTAVLNQRPQSAKKTTVVHFQPPSAKAKPVAPKSTPVVSTKRSRPSSAKTKRPVSAKARKVKVNDDKGNGKRGNSCSYCGNLTDRGIDYNAGNYFSVCKNCRKQSSETGADVDSFARATDSIDCECREVNTNVVAMRMARDIIELEEQQCANQGASGLNDLSGQRSNFVDSSYKGMQYGRQGTRGSTVMYRSEVIYSAAEQNQPNEGVITNTDESDSTQTQNTPSEDVINFEFESPNQSNELECLSQSSEGQILTSLDDLDRSLTDVQREIKDCLTKHHSESEPCDQSNQSESDTCQNVQVHSNVMQNKVTFEPLAGEFSSKLIGDSDHKWEAVQDNVTVYQFVEKDVDSTLDENKSHDQDSHVTDGSPGDITTYDVAMMRPIEQSEKELDLSTSNCPVQSEDASLLEVRATAANIIRQTSDVVTQPIAPHPALASTINARPPKGFMYYFAYGMDMNPDRLSTYIRREITDRFWGLLFGFKLLFNKKGLDVEAGGFPNLELCAQSSVEGSLQLITETELNFLDKSMGYPEHYEHVVLPVWQLNCMEADDLGVAQYCVPAVMYLAKDRWTHRGGTPLDGSYAADQCLKGPTFLSPGYTAKLHQHQNYSQ